MCISEAQNVARWFNTMIQRIIDAITKTMKSPHRTNVNLLTSNVDGIDCSVAFVLWTTIRVTDNTAAVW